MERNGIFRVSTFLGIFPFRRNGSVLQIDKALVLYSLVFNATIAAVFFYYTVISIWYSNLKSYNMYLTAGFYGFNLLVFFRFPVNIYYNKEAIVEIIDDLNTLESSFHKMGLEIKNCYRKKIILFDLLAPVLFGIIFYIGWNTNGNISSAVGLTLALLEMALVGGQFCFLVDTVSDFFDSGIKLLILMAHPASRERNLRTTERFVTKTGRLISVLRSLNSIYSRHILICMTVHFVGIIIQLYYVIFNSSADEEWRRTGIPGDFLMVLYRFYFVWRVSHSAVQVGNKSKEFNSQLYELMIDDKTNEILHNDILRLHISMKREVVFTACGFFNLDYTLVHSMIASATTYLVILIQFE